MKASEAKIATWTSHLQAQRESGLTQEGYCQQHELKSHQFWYWKKKLDGSGNVSTKPIQPSSDKSQPIPRQTSEQKFVPVSLSTPPQARQESLTIKFPSGISLIGVDSHNQLLVRQLIEVLL